MRPIHIIHLVNTQVSQGPGTVPYKYRLNPDIAQGCFYFPNLQFYISISTDSTLTLLKAVFYSQKMHFYIFMVTSRTFHG